MVKGTDIPLLYTVYYTLGYIIIIIHIFNAKVELCAFSANKNLRIIYRKQLNLSRYNVF